MLPSVRRQVRRVNAPTDLRRRLAYDTASPFPVPRMSVRTRFAPSPTGYLHIGGARTALYSWLYARRHQGTFILRIEDTDLERSTPESVQAIMEGMSWLSLSFDEGPFFQTHRFDRYRQVIAQLLEQGNAYHCYCTKEELEALRGEQVARKEKPRYNRHCREHARPRSGVQPVVRFKNPMGGEVVVDDLIKGRVVFSNDELDDLIIARSDGTPTYNFTVVVDDMDMEITHVIRGDDHLNNTPRQINMLRALGAQPPVYAHVPMILGADGARLSKRHGAVSVTQYRDDGYLPDALLNYLIRLGWSHGDQEIFSREEMIALFDVAKVHGSPASFNPEKLLWLNQHYIKQADATLIAPRFEAMLWDRGIDPTQGPALLSVIEVQRDRAKTLAEMAENSRLFFQDDIELDAASAAKHLTSEVAHPLTRLRDALQELGDWSPEAVHTQLDETARQVGLTFGKLAQPVRVAVAGRPVSPPIDVTLSLIGKSRVLRRIDAALSSLIGRGNSAPA